MESSKAKGGKANTGAKEEEKKISSDQMEKIKMMMMVFKTMSAIKLTREDNKPA